MTLQSGKYKHYKGKDYEVIGVARHSETLEELVVYKALYQNDSPTENLRRTKGENLWVRPLKMFTEMVVVDGKEVKRFEYVG